VRSVAACSLRPRGAGDRASAVGGTRGAALPGGGGGKRMPFFGFGGGLAAWRACRAWRAAAARASRCFITAWLANHFVLSPWAIAASMAQRAVELSQRGLSGPSCVMRILTRTASRPKSNYATRDWAATISS